MTKTNDAFIPGSRFGNLWTAGECAYDGEYRVGKGLGRGRIKRCGLMISRGLKKRPAFDRLLASMRGSTMHAKTPTAAVP